MKVQEDSINQAGRTFVNDFAAYVTSEIVKKLGVWWS